MRKLIYIMGCSHCGSTLLTTLLGRHSQIATVGELKVTAIPDIQTYLCSCGERMLDCEFWKDVQKSCARRQVELDLRDFNTHFRGNGWLSDRLIRSGVRSTGWEALRSAGLGIFRPAGNHLSSLLNRNSAIMDAVCETQKKAHFLDGSKDPVRLMHFARSGLFDIRAIHLVRDGRAIVASLNKRNPNTSHNVLSWRAKSLECEWAKSQLKESKLLTLRYEDMCADLPGTLRNLFQFMEIPDESEACLDDTPHACRHIMGHDSRLSSVREVKVRKDWTSLLTESELQLFEKTEGDLNKRYGYEPRAGQVQAIAA